MVVDDIQVATGLVDVPEPKVEVRRFSLAVVLHEALDEGVRRKRLPPAHVQEVGREPGSPWKRDAIGREIRLEGRGAPNLYIDRRSIGRAVAFVIPPNPRRPPAVDTL